MRFVFKTRHPAGVTEEPSGRAGISFLHRDGFGVHAQGGSISSASELPTAAARGRRAPGRSEWLI